MSRHDTAFAPPGCHSNDVPPFLAEETLELLELRRYRQPGQKTGPIVPPDANGTRRISTEYLDLCEDPIAPD